MLGLVAILEGDQKPFRRAQEPDADDRGQRQKDDEMHPKGRLIDNLGPQRGAEHKEAAEQGHENRGTVTRVGEREIQAADLAARHEGQESGEHFAHGRSADSGRGIRSHRERSHDICLRHSSHDLKSARRAALPRKGQGGLRRLAVTLNARWRRPKIPTHKCRRTGTATRRRRSANTRRQTRSPDAASAKTARGRPAAGRHSGRSSR